MNDRETLVRYTEPWSREIVASSGGGRGICARHGRFCYENQPGLAAGFIRIPRKIFVLKKIFALILHFEFYRYIILVLTFYNHIIIALEKPNINILLLEILKSTIHTYNVTTLVFLGIRLVAVYGRHQVVGLPLWGQPLWRKRIVDILLVIGISIQLHLHPVRGILYPPPISGNSSPTMRSPSPRDGSCLDWNHECFLANTAWECKTVHVLLETTR